jgi:hypothetical protein
MKILISLLTLLLFNVCVNALVEYANLSVIAGNGASGFSGDGGSALDAMLNLPYHVWSDSHGNTYFTDFSNDRARVVYADTGAIDTLIGDSFSLVHPWGISGDTLGTAVYVAESTCVWKLNISSGETTRYAGSEERGTDNGPATSALFYELAGIWLTTDGTLYLTDQSLSNVRKIDSNQIVSHVSGFTGPLPSSDFYGFAGDNDGYNSSAVRYYGPSSCYVDTSGVLFVGDRNNSRIRKLDLVGTGLITTFAGGGTLTNEGIIATDYSFLSNSIHSIAGDLEGNLFIVGVFESKVFRIDKNQIITTYFGSGIVGTTLGTTPWDANLNGPTGIYFNIYSNVTYLAEGFGNVLKKSFIPSDNPPSNLPSSSPSSAFVNQEHQNLIVIAGDGATGYSGDGGPGTSAALANPLLLWSDSVGNTFFTDFSNNCVRVIDSVTGVINTVLGMGPFFNDNYDPSDGVATALKLDHPYGISGDTHGTTLFVSDMYHIWKYNMTSGMRVRYAGSPGGSIFGYGPTIGDGGPAKDALFHSIAGIWLTTDGTLYLVDRDAHVVRKIDPDNQIINLVSGSRDNEAGFAGDGGPYNSPIVRFEWPISCYVDTSGVLFVGDQSYGRVRRLDLTTDSGLITTYAGGAPYIVNNHVADPVEGVVATDYYFRQFAVYGICGDLHGNLFIAADGKIYKVDGNQIITTYFGSMITGLTLGMTSWNASLDGPFGVYFNTHNNVMYIAETAGNVVKKSLRRESTPTNSPTYYSSPIPAPSPTSHPSPSPTATPTSTAIVYPSSIPSSSPSILPSVHPSVFPTSPSFSPTLAPNVNDQVHIEGTLLVKDVLSNVLSAVSTIILTDALDDVSGYAEIVKVTFVKLVSKDEHLKDLSLATFSFEIDFLAVYYLSYYTGWNSSFVAEIKSKTIKDAVESGAFQVVLQHLALISNSSDLFRATCDTVMLSATIISPETSSSTSDNRDGTVLYWWAIAGIVIIGVIAVLLIFCLFLCLFSKESEIKRLATDDYDDSMKKIVTKDIELFV